MTPTEMKNLTVLASAVDLIGAVAAKVLSGNASVDGQKITPSTVRILATSNLNKVLSENSHDR